MNLKKALLLTAAITTLGALAIQAAPVKIGFSNRTLNGPYFNALTQYLEQYGKEAGFEVIATDAKADMNKQMADVDDLLAQGIKYLVLNAQDPDAGIRIAENAHRKGVKVICIDSGIDVTAPVVTRIMADNYNNGRLTGEFAVDQFGDKPINLVIVDGNQGNIVAMQRRTGFMVGVLEEQIRKYNHSNLNILSQVWGNWDQQGGLKAMEDSLVAQGDKINAVYSVMDDMSLGICRALKAAGKTKDIKVFSHDGYSKGMLAVKNGEIEATAINSPGDMAKAAIDVIKKMEAGETNFPTYTYMKPVVITKKNVDQYYNPKGLF